jgi:hypothetical protein
LWVYVIFGSNADSIARVSRAIASSVDWSNEYEARPAIDVHPSEIRSPALVFLGCPSGGAELDRPIRRLLDHLPASTMYGVVWAVYETRREPFPLIAGSGIRRLRRAIEHRGGHLVGVPQSFRVEDATGTIGHLELERARVWGTTTIAAAVRNFGDPYVHAGCLSGVPLRPAWELALAVPG